MQANTNAIQCRNEVMRVGDNNEASRWAPYCIRLNSQSNKWFPTE